MVRTYLRRDTEADPQQVLGDAPSLGDVLISGNDAGSLSITGLADPSDDQDAATKAYVDGEGVPTLDTVLSSGNDVAEQDIVAKDAGVVRAALQLSPAGVAAFSIKDALGVEVANITLDGTTLSIGVGSGTAAINIGSDGAFSHAGPVGALAVAADGQVTFTVAGLKFIGLGTTDPGSGGVWINPANGGALTVGDGA